LHCGRLPRAGPGAQSRWRAGRRRAEPPVAAPPVWKWFADMNHQTKLRSDIQAEESCAMDDFRCPACGSSALTYPRVLENDEPVACASAISCKSRRPISAVTCPHSKSRRPGTYQGTNRLWVAGFVTHWGPISAPPSCLRSFHSVGGETRTDATGAQDGKERSFSLGFYLCGRRSARARPRYCVGDGRLRYCVKLSSAKMQLLVLSRRSCDQPPWLVPRGLPCRARGSAAQVDSIGTRSDWGPRRASAQ
jgi:hypothetical protein